MLICIVLFKEIRFNTFMVMFTASDHISYASRWFVIYTHTQTHTHTHTHTYIYIYIYAHLDAYLRRHQFSFGPIFMEILTNLKSQNVTITLTLPFKLMTCRDIKYMYL